MDLLLNLVRASKKYWGYLITSILAIIGMTACQLYAPLVVRRLTELAVNADANLSSDALRMGLVLAVVYLGQGAFTYIRSYFTHYAAWNFVADMRVRVYDRLQALSLKFYHDKQTGQLMSRVVNDTDKLEVLIAHAVPDIIVNIIILIGVAVILFVINPVLAALSLLTMPLLVAFSVWFSKRVRPMFRRAQQIMGELNANLQDNISGMKEIQVFNQYEREHEKVKTTAVRHSNSLLDFLRLSAFYNGIVQYLSSIGTVIVIAYGGYLASRGLLPVADIVAFLMYLGIFYQPITTLARVNEDLQSAAAGAERVFEILDAEIDVKEAENPHTLSRVRGRIEFKNVFFNYTDGSDVLKDINVTIEPGEIVALVGPTGVGKTTFINLLNRFYDPARGDVLIDGYNLKDVSLRSLRDNLSNVIQDVFLFNDSVAENIAYGRPDATRGEITKASEVARADEFICQLNEGYDTIIGERGIRLSGGQKQRLSIARAVLRDTPVLILDEATASVDVETEKLIHEAMDEIMKGRTTIIIAHRLSTVKKADKIIV
ncbi:MAG: ABC transporter ATP-binding protein/permease, partial [Clostridiales bacterium]|nr:ABC transporter ATP-binding protein/permease [Clostridiales bacterium]